MLLPGNKVDKLVILPRNGEGVQNRKSCKHNMEVMILQIYYYILFI